MTADSARDPILDDLRQADLSVLLFLWRDLLTDSPHDTAAVAFALREKARAGELADDAIPLLVILLVDAPDLAVFVHLAKALAAFGRKATSASPYITARLVDLHVTSDRRFWALDAALWALAHCGGEAALTFLEGLEQESPPVVARKNAVYRGSLGAADRTAIHKDTLEGARALLQAPLCPGGWRAKQTTDEAVDEEAPKRTPGLLVR